MSNANNAIIKYSFGTSFSIHSVLMWSKNNLDWTKTSAAFTDTDIEFFSLCYPLHEYTVSQSGMSWWLNKLFDFWIILRLTEFEMCAACNVLLAQKDELCYWQRKVAKLHFSLLLCVAELVFLSDCRLPRQQGPPGRKVQFPIFSPDLPGLRRITHHNKKMNLFYK